MPPTRPHVVIVVADDMGYSDLGCYGGEVATPTLDRLGRAGVRLTRFYNATRCSPSRASMLTGLHPHQPGIGILTSDDRPDGYRGSLNERCLTLAEMLREAGYATCLSGKWHLTRNYPILAASLVLFSVPVLGLYFLFQQQFVEGVTAGALKHWARGLPPGVAD